MSTSEILDLKNINSFESLVDYLKDKLYWPIEAEDAEDITFDYTPEDLGIEEQYVPKIKSIKQIRPLTDNQPWGLFYIDFETKKLPVVVLRRLLRALIFSSRKRDDRMKSWNLHDLIFISSLGEAEKRQVSFAHFSETSDGLPELRTFSWDVMDTHFHYAQTQVDLEKLRWPDDESDADAWREQWTSAFRLRHREVIRTSQQLATAMARLAIQIRDRVKEVFEYEMKNGPLHNLFDNFEQVLIHDLTIDSFADMYAQTITYGLFSTRASHERDFEVEDITAMIPNTNPFLKNLFEECTRLGNSVSENLDLVELGVSELIILLKESNIEAVLQDFGRQKKNEDPVIHFYEDFLREYDSHQRVKRGVFYTPDPVVSFIVRSVDHILRTEFDCHDGLADTSTTKLKYERKSKKSKKLIEDVKDVPKVQVLDPATGTGTFLKYVIKEIKSTFNEKHKGLSEDELKEEWNKYVPKHLLSRIFGFELMAAPYAVAHLKLGLELSETGYDFKSDKRLGVYLTNTLEGTHEGAGTLDAFLNWLAEEGRRADEIKANSQISVVIGNPPYAGHSANESKWIADLLRGKIKDKSRISNYFEVDGEPLGERNPKWLNDDYVKFIRFGQWRIDKTGQGILAFITNHRYIKNTTFRGMRQQLMKSFTDLYILDLHGNVEKKEKSPDGSKDDNVFDIKQGVSIGIFIKKPQNSAPSKVYHADMWGSKEEKYKQLFENKIDTIEWEEVTPTSPYYFFFSQDDDLKQEYELGWEITKLMPTNVLGFQTHRDHFAIDIDKNELRNRISTLHDNDYTDYEIRNTYNINDKQDWKLATARQQIQSDEEWELHFIQCLYRPFDWRSCYFSKAVMDRPRRELINHVVFRDNLCLGIGRQVFQGHFRHAIISSEPMEANVTQPANGCVVFPLYLYSNQSSNKINDTDSEIKKANINPNFLKELNTRFGKESTPENILYYIYAILHSPKYRNRYADFLKRDFPRIPFTSNSDLFLKISRIGMKLTSLHLMKSDKLYNLITEFKGKGDYIVATIGKNSYDKGVLKINKSQYFDGIPEEVYNFHIGGYQVCQKWLKDRKGRTLTEEEIEHYQKIVVAINETIHIMKKIDEVIEEHGGWPIK